MLMNKCLAKMQVLIQKVWSKPAPRQCPCWHYSYYIRVAEALEKENIGMSLI